MQMSSCLCSPKLRFINVNVRGAIINSTLRYQPKQYKNTKSYAIITTNSRYQPDQYKNTKIQRVWKFNCQCARRDHNPHFKIPARVVTSGGAHIFKDGNKGARATIYSMICTTWCVSHCARCKILHKKIALVLLYIQWYPAPFGAFRHCNILHI